MEGVRKRMSHKFAFFATSVLLLAIISTTKQVNALNLSDPEDQSNAATAPSLAEVDTDADAEYRYNYPI